jgi:hypothetical protein
MGGFFGGGSNTTTTPTATSTTSPAQEALISALSPYQVAEAGAQSGLATSGATGLQAGVTSAGASLPNILQMSPEELALPGATESAVGSVQPQLQSTYNALGTSLAQPAAAAPIMPAMTSVDANSLLAPITENFNENILPGIRSQALAAGATGGTAESDLTKRAVGEFGTMSASELSKQQIGLENAAANLQGAATGQAGMENQFTLGQQQANQQGAGIQSALATALTQMGMMGPNQAAATAAQGRGLATQQAQVPISLANALLSGSSGVPVTQTPVSPMAVSGGSTSSMPTAGAQAGAGLSSILPLLLSMWGSG